MRCATDFAESATATVLCGASLQNKSLPEVKALCRAAGLPSTGRKSILVRALVDPRAPIRLRRTLRLAAHEPLTGTYPPRTEGEVDAAAMDAACVLSACLHAALVHGHAPLPNGRLALDYVLHSAPCLRCEEREVNVAVRDLLRDQGCDEPHATCACGAQHFLHGLCIGEAHFASRADTEPHAALDHDPVCVAAAERRLALEAEAADEEQLVHGEPALRLLSIPHNSMLSVIKEPTDWSFGLSTPDADDLAGESPPQYCAEFWRDTAAEGGEPPPRSFRSTDDSEPRADERFAASTEGLGAPPRCPPLSPVSSATTTVLAPLSPALSAIDAGEPPPFGPLRSTRASPVSSDTGLLAHRRRPCSPVLSAIAHGMVYSPIASGAPLRLPEGGPSPTFQTPDDSAPAAVVVKRRAAGRKRLDAASKLAAAAPAAPHPLPKRKRSSAWDRLCSAPIFTLH